MAPSVNDILNNRYRIVASIGRGGMAEVYKVWDKVRSVPMACKLLRDDFADDVVFLRRFRREAQTLAKLQHPSIVRFYGLVEDKDFVFILQDFIDGPTLKKEIKRKGKSFTSKEIIDILAPVCSALNYAHRIGLVHCDIKSANIMLDTQGKVFLTDFGIARMSEGATTATMVGAGTPAYMAPELVKGLDPTSQTDIYGLGIVLYEMLTGGERPFTGERATITGTTGEKVRWEQLNLDPPKPRVYNPAISRELEVVVMKCLVKDPQHRYRTTLDLLNDLQDVLGNVDQPKHAPVVKPVETKKQYPVEEEQKELPIDMARLVKPKTLTQSEIKRRILQFIVGGVGVVILILLIIEALRGLKIKASPTATPVATEAPATAAPIIAPVAATAPATAAPTTVPIVTEAPTEAPLGIGSTMVSTKDGMTMVYVPEGEFLMGNTADQALAQCQKYETGCQRDWFLNEEPPHSVTLDAYWIDQTEVTNAMYQKCVIAGDCTPPSSSQSNTRDSYFGNSEFDDYPVIHMDWNQAQKYCVWAGRKLPTEAEWEKAARGTEGQTFPWQGEEVNNNLANFNNYVGDTTQVGKYPTGKSPYDAYDMAGNVWEWVADWYEENYYLYRASSNPKGPSTGDYRVLRGGSWEYNGVVIHSAYRDGFISVPSSSSIGFRCALPLH